MIPNTLQQHPFAPLALFMQSKSVKYLFNEKSSLMKKPILMYCSLLSLGLYLASCTKADLKDTVEDTTEMENTASDYSAAETAFEDVFDIVDEEAQQQGDLNGFVPIEGAEDRGCAEVTITRNSTDIFPLTMTLDFSNDGCALPDGREVSGIITTVFTGRLRDAGSIFTITFSNFVLNGNTINGTKTITNNGLNTAGQLSYTIVVENGSVVLANGTTVTYQTNRTRTWVEGMDTNFENDGMAGVMDDVWEITGTASGVNRNGNAYEVNVTTPLRREMDCRWLTAGVMEIDSDGFDKTIIIDYGDGTCDDKATVTIGIFQREIVMR